MAMTKAQLAERVAALEAQLETKKPELEPGFKVVDHDATYEKWKARRVLDDGTVIHWFIKDSKKEGLWIDFQCNLRFGRKGGPIPGMGGSRQRWTKYDAYFTGGDYVADRKAVVAACKKLA